MYRFKEKIIQCTSKYWKLLTLICCIIFMAFLNIIRIFDNNFWGDEAFSIQLVKMTIPELITITARDVHPPLYYLILKIFYNILGNHGYVYHLVSVIPVLLGMIFAATKIKKRFGYGVTLIFLVLSTLSSSSLVYNVEARMYSWAFFFVVICFWYGYEILSDDRIRFWIIFTLSGLAAAYTHYYALLTVAFIYAGVFVALVFKDIKKIKSCLICSIVTILCYMPWLKIFLTTFTNVSNGWWSTTIPSFKSCIKFMFGGGIYGTGLLLIFVVALTLYFLKIFRLHYKSKEVRRDDAKTMNADHQILSAELKVVFNWILIGILATVGTIIVGEAASYLIRPLFLERYLYQVTGILWLVLGVAFINVFEKKRYIIFVLLFCFYFGFTAWRAQYIAERHSNELAEKSVDFMNENLNEGDIIITDNSHFSWTVLQYYFPNNLIYSLNGFDWELMEEGTDVLLCLSNEILEDLALEIEQVKGNTSFISEGRIGNSNFYCYKISFDHEVSN